MAERLLTLFANVSVPCDIVNQSRGTDGVTYYLCREAPFASVRASWWHRGPENWTELTRTFHEAWEELDQLRPIAVPINS
ncbi:MAG: hypothetical protein HOW73_49040 [Polyangiaceae bacterium]|nr:hypothetical protein [Polyangiaceae bacterium]